VMPKSNRANLAIDSKVWGDGQAGACYLDIKPDKRWVVYSGNDGFPLDAHTEAIGLTALVRRLQEQGRAGE